MRRPSVVALLGLAVGFIAVSAPLWLHVGTEAPVFPALPAAQGLRLPAQGLRLPVESSVEATFPEGQFSKTVMDDSPEGENAVPGWNGENGGHGGHGGQVERCVLPTETMRARHMFVLRMWRDKAIRDGMRLEEIPAPAASSIPATPAMPAAPAAPTTPAAPLMSASGVADAESMESTTSATAANRPRSAMPLRLKACLDCHGGREVFCDACHLPYGASPDCWNCHISESPTP